MDQQQIENTIQFLVENQAKFHTELELLKVSVQGISENQKETDRQIKALAENTNAQIQILVESQHTLVGHVEAMRQETQDAFDNLIIGNEVTRNFANEIAKLTVNISQRLTIVEQKTKDL
jgi:predicted outer membrane protein